MFEEHRAKKAAREHQDVMAAWQAQRDGTADLLAVAREFNGTGSTDIMLGSGEAVFYQVTGAALVEDRRGQGHYQGASTGLSVPVGNLGGHAVRYRVGASRGHYVQAPPTPTAIDTGALIVTNQRVIFQGANQTRECAFSKLIGTQHDDTAGATTFSVSNRQKPTTVHYGPALAAAFDFHLELALAHYRGTVATIVAQLEADLNTIESQRPVDPASA